MTAHDDVPVLDIEHVEVRFGGVRALDGVSLDVAKGEIHGLIGPNGAGKSVLFDVICGLRRPNAGRVRIDGIDVTRQSALRRARLGIRRTFQVPQVFGPLTVLENLLVPQEWRGESLPGDLLGLARAREHERRDRAEDILRRSGLHEVRDRYAGSLPIGPARALEVARSMVDPPRLLLLDEPCSGMDRPDADRLAETIRRLTDSTTSVLVVEHDVRFVMDLCTKIAVLDVGRLLTRGPAREVAEDPRVRTAYLGEPAAGAPAE